MHLRNADLLYGVVKLRILEEYSQGILSYKMTLKLKETWK